MKESKYIPFTGKDDIWMLDNIRCSGTTVIVNRVIDYYKEYRYIVLVSASNHKTIAIAVWHVSAFTAYGRSYTLWMVLTRSLLI